MSRLGNAMRRAFGEDEDAASAGELEDGGDLVLWIVAIGLMLLSGYRSVHLVSSTLPEDAKILGFAALAALDVGALAWLSFAGHAMGDRHTLALIMLTVDLAGIGAALIADTALVVGARPELVRDVAIWVVPVITIANVVATMAAKAMSPAAKARKAEALRQARIARERQRAQDEIDNASLQAELAMMRNKAATMRAQVAASFGANGNDNGAGAPMQSFAADGQDAPRFEDASPKAPRARKR